MSAGDVRSLDPDVLVAAVKKLRPLASCGPVTILCVGDHAPHLRALVAALDLPAVVTVDDTLADRGESITLRGWKPPKVELRHATLPNAAPRPQGAWWRGFDKFGRRKR